MIQRDSTLERYQELDDERTKDSFRQAFENTSNLQNQIDTIVSLLNQATDFANFKSLVNSEFS